MGMYTELIFGVSLKKDTPEEVIEILKFMIGENVKEPEKLPDHPLFGDTRWRFMLSCSSYYFGLSNPVTYMKRDNLDKRWRISTRSNVKNYDDEIEKFLDWIKPYIDSGSGEREMYAIVTYEEGMPEIYYLED